MKLLSPIFYSPTLYGRKRPFHNAPSWAKAEPRRHIFRLIVLDGELPLNILLMGMADMPRSATSIWIKSKREVDRYCRAIQQSGRRAHVERHEARRCELCGRWFPGIAGEILRRQREQERAFDEPMKPCNRECSEIRAAKAQKGKHVGRNQAYHKGSA